MKTILDTIVDVKRQEVVAAKSKIRYSDFEQFDYFNRTCFSFNYEFILFIFTSDLMIDI